MSQELFSHLPEQRKSRQEMIDVAELDTRLKKASSNDRFSYERNTNNGYQELVAVGKGLVVKYRLDLDSNKITRVGFSDSFATADGTPNDVAPLTLDTEKLLTEIETTLRAVIDDVTDPVLVDTAG